MLIGSAQGEASVLRGQQEKDPPRLSPAQPTRIQAPSSQRLIGPAAAPPHRRGAGSACEGQEGRAVGAPHRIELSEITVTL